MLGTELSSQDLTIQVLSPLTVFTAVFGMGTGVFRSHLHQATKNVIKSRSICQGIFIALPFKLDN